MKARTEDEGPSATVSRFRERKAPPKYARIEALGSSEMKREFREMAERCQAESSSMRWIGCRARKRISSGTVRE